MPDENMSASRRNARKDLITLFAALDPGTEISFEEIAAMVGLDAAKTGDRNLIYAVREHCRDVLGIVIDAVAGRGYRRVTDDEIADKVTERRRDRIYRQSLRGAAESVALRNFSGLTHDRQMRVLAHQSIFGAVALASHVDGVKRLTSHLESAKVEKVDPDEVMKAIGGFRQ